MCFASFLKKNAVLQNKIVIIALLLLNKDFLHLINILTGLPMRDFTQDTDIDSVSFDMPMLHASEETLNFIRLFASDYDRF